MEHWGAPFHSENFSPFPVHHPRPDDSLASKPPFPPLSSSCSPNFGHKGAWQALNCGAFEANARQYRLAGSQRLGGGRPEGSRPHLPWTSAHPHPGWPIHPKGSTKNATNLALARPLTRNAGISCFFLQILRARSKF